MGSLSFGFKGFLKMCFVFSALVLACTVGIASASAAVVTWQGDESVNWGTGGNWSTGSVPGTADIATFDGTGNTPCTINTAANVRGIDINTMDPLLLIQVQPLFPHQVIYIFSIHLR
ncbi:MAG: hypothetical protein UW03_C0014G0003 [Candidatus Peregrinibacteria bacterium GW2011_GWA2_43_8]|nr:MAG: hypothetical protein UW03_C0014G0003 [Candidatus Peregrinibacteria bacterium GW2011_GWA2_43_8]